jgi:hypothetical protein
MAEGTHLYDASLGTVENPLASIDDLCPRCGDLLWSPDWNLLAALLTSMFDETADLIMVCCIDKECGWQGSARK